MSDNVKPALTAEEWARHLAGDPSRLTLHILPPTDCEYVPVPGDRRHALAALALHGQPFGFTREMLSAADAVARYDATPEDMDLFYAMMANVRALLPPEPTP